LLEDFSDILPHHILALSRNKGQWGKNMVGKNIQPIKVFASVLPCYTMRCLSLVLFGQTLFSANELPKLLLPSAQRRGQEYSRWT
jgi:hypothetical protein